MGQRKEFLLSIGEQTRAYPPGSIESFEYPPGPEGAEIPGSESWDEAPQSKSPQDPQTPVSESSQTKLRAEFDRRCDQETRRAFEAGREKGRQEGRALEREAQVGEVAAAQQQRAKQVSELIENSRQEREQYFEQVEREVVGLALAIAARILRREAQMDPLLLTGAVRVVLGQLAATTTVRLKVPPEEVGLWTENLSLLPNLAIRPEVKAGKGMQLGDCMIETEMGSVDLGVRAQLGEIERGFFDGAARAPTGSAVVAERPEKKAETMP